VVARATNKPCVVGRDATTWTDSGLQLIARGEAVDIYPGDVVSIDGDTGRVWLGIVPRQGVGAAWRMTYQ
jgi:phosphoenolpyruvate synthase/pyruvate phosphate dikinase